VFRNLFILASCVALATLSVSGSHLHVFEEHAHAGEGLGDHARVFSSFDADHHPSHEHHGAIDSDNIVKAFGKLTAQGVGPLLLIVLALASVPGVARGQVLAWTSPHPPPKPRSRSYLHPPSQAPPRAA
jgi:hypothetical protein